MLYLIHGSDFNKAREKLHKLVHSLLSRRPGASYFKLGSENFRAAALDEYVGGQGLFEKKFIVLLDRLLGEAEVREVILKRAAEIASSDNIFIVFEENLPAAAKKLTKLAERVVSFARPAGEVKAEKFNIFSLTDALGRRDRRRAWLLFVKALRAGLPEEQIHGTLFWQIKAMLLSERSRSAASAGLAPFVYAKSKAYAKNFELGEIKKILRDLVFMYHEARRGGPELALSLERFILQI
ncbi:MAG: hypothetical protein HYT43_01535 [Candidatus Taylorbacteria bacterium]|nr:hypothetical protein [Candidatus Taylorbacteria bacterium]